MNGEIHRHCTTPFAHNLDIPETPDEKELIDRLLASMDFPDDIIDEIVVGDKLILVRSGKRASIAATMGSSHPERAPEMNGMTGRSLREAAELLHHDDLLHRSLGAAAFNASMELPENPGGENALDSLLREGTDREMVLVGDFPFTPRLRKRARILHLLELKDVPGRTPPERWNEVLSKCEVAGITGTAVLTRSMARYLNLARNAWKVIIGSTTPLSPVLLEHYGVNLLAGSRIDDVDSVIDGVRRGLCIAELHRGCGLEFVSISRRTWPRRSPQKGN